MAFNLANWEKARADISTQPTFKLPTKPVPKTGLSSVSSYGSHTPVNYGLGSSKPEARWGISIPSSYSVPTRTAESTAPIVSPVDVVGGVIDGAKGTLSFAKDIAQSTARTVGTAGITAGNLPFQLTKSVGVKGVEIPFQDSIDTTGSPITRAVFGDTPVKTFFKYGEAGAKSIEDVTGIKIDSRLNGLLAVGGILTDLSFGGGKGKLFEEIAKSKDVKFIDDILKKELPGLSNLPPEGRTILLDTLRTTENPKQVEDIITHVAKTADDAAKSVAPRIFSETNLPVVKPGEKVVRFVRNTDGEQWIDTNVTRPHEYPGKVEYGVVPENLIKSTGNAEKDAYGYGLIDSKIADEVVNKNIVKSNILVPDHVGEIPFSPVQLAELPKTQREALISQPDLTNPSGLQGLKDRGRGVVTHEQAIEAATQLGWTEEKMLNFPVGKAFSDTELLAARGLSQNADNVLTSMRDTLSAIDPASMEAKQLRDTIALQKIKAFKLKTVVVGAATESGRALSSLRASVKSIDGFERKIAKILNKTDTPQEVKDFITNTISKFDGTPKDFAKLLRDLQDPSVMDMIVEFATAVKLTAIPTHIVNTLTSTGMIGMRVMERGISVLFDSLRAGITGSKRERFFSDVKNEIIGQMAGWRSSGKEALNALRDENYAWDSKNLQDFSMQGPKIRGRAGKNELVDKILNPLGKVIRTPFRGLGAMDLFLRQPAEQGAMYVLIGREAVQKGLKPGTKEYAEFIANAIHNPTVDTLENVSKQADRALFQDELAPSLSKIQNYISEYPAIKFVIPFFKTIANLQKRALEYSPLAPVLKSVRTDLKTAGSQADALTRMAVGTAVMIPLTYEALDGNITLEAPKNPAERDAFFAEGKQAYSIKWGDQWIPFARFSPFSEWFVTAGLMGKAIENKDDKSIANLTADTFFGLTANLFDKSFATGMADFMDAIRGTDKERANWLNNFVVGSTLPTLSGNIARSTDPIIREVNSLKEAYMARIPGLSQKLNARRDVFGKPISRAGSAIERLISPVVPSNITKDLVRNELNNLGITMGFPSDSAGGFKMTPEQFYDYQVIAGNVTYKAMSDFIMSPAYQGLSAQQKEKSLNRIMTEIRTAVKTKVATEQVLIKEIQNRFEKMGMSSVEAKIEAVNAYSKLKEQQSNNRPQQ